LSVPVSSVGNIHLFHREMLDLVYNKHVKKQGAGSPGEALE